MKSFSFNPSEVDGNLYYEIWAEINNLRYYFKKFNSNEAEEAMHLAFMHSITHYDAKKGGLKFYIMALARTIEKGDNDLVLVDFLEQTVSDDAQDMGVFSTRSYNDHINEVNIDDAVVEKLYLSINRYPEVAELALAFMPMFLTLCKSIKNKDSSSRYYSDIFIRESLKISKKCKNFNQICLQIYEQYGKAMSDFLAYDKEDKQNWREVDFSFIRGHWSKRIFLCDNNGTPIADADMQPYKLKGDLGGKAVYKVEYVDLWYSLCDIIDERSISPLSFTIGEHVVYRTLGGNYTIVDPHIDNVYELFKMEILTNILFDTEGRIMNIGSQCFYILCKPMENLQLPKRSISGVNIDLRLEQVLF